MKLLSLLLLISISTVQAATPGTASAPKTPTTPSGTSTIPAATGATTATATPAPPAPPPPSVKLAYYGEYIGPRISNFDLTKSQGPTDPAAAYTGISHSIKIAYAVSPDVIIGLQTRGASSFDPMKGFGFKDERIYVAWKHMIDTADVDMTGVVDIELPTTQATRNKGRIVAFNIKNNWTLKTSLRDWTFSILTILRPIFYNVPTTQTDIWVAVDPYISLSVAPSVSIVLQGNFDASHNYNDAYFAYGQDDPDYFGIGPEWAVSSHLQIYPALQFYTADLSQPILYLGVSASL